jgi:hypothetical protein
MRGVQDRPLIPTMQAISCNLQSLIFYSDLAVSKPTPTRQWDLVMARVKRKGRRNHGESAVLQLAGLV